MTAGTAFDFTEEDEDGEPWDLSDEKIQQKAIDRINKEKPFMLVTSPMCAKHNALQALFNYPKMDGAVVFEGFAEAMKH